MDGALKTALERNGFDDRKGAELDAAVRRLEEQQRQTLALLLELRTSATPMPAAPRPGELASPGPAGMAAADLPAAAPKPARLATKRAPAKSTKVASGRASASAKAAKAAKTTKSSQPRKRATSTAAGGGTPGPTPRAQVARRSTNRAGTEPSVVSRGRNNTPAPAPEPEPGAPRTRRARPLRARGR